MKDRLVFLARKIVRWFGERNPATLGTLRNAFHVFAATPATRERCLSLGVPSDRVSLCQAIALSETEIDFLSRFPIVRNPVFFGMGLLIHRKRYDLAVRAFAEADIPGSRLVLIGGGPEERTLRRLAERLHVGERLEITGTLPRFDAWNRMSACAVMIHPCDLESGGCVVQESLAAGRPVVGLNLGGPAMMVDSEVGRLVDPDATGVLVDELSRAMRSLAQLPTRERMAGACQKKARIQFAWNAKASAYFDILQIAAHAGR